MLVKSEFAETTKLPYFNVASRGSAGQLALSPQQLRQKDSFNVDRFAVHRQRERQNHKRLNATLVA
jgi:hypothetical protein